MNEALTMTPSLSADKRKVICGKCSFSKQKAESEYHLRNAPRIVLVYDFFLLL
jgi:hypothetical protein